MKSIRHRASGIGIVLCGAVIVTACPPSQSQPTPAAIDSTAIRDSLARVARADSLARAARADSLARARADSIAAAAERNRADSVRAQIQRDGADAGASTPSGLPPAEDQLFSEPLYFETDRAELTADSRALLDRKIEVLRRYTRLYVQIEGHCDERGPDEYNLALGNRRAMSIKRYLVDRGIAEDRVSIVSYGEERPAVAGSGEEAWSRNRRAEFRATRSAR